MSVSVIIGTFDGVHLGHAALVEHARRCAGPTGTVLVLAFDPHPLTTLRPDFAPPRLTTLADRTELLRSLGVDRVHRLTPDLATLQLTPSQFIERIAVEHRPDHIIEGPDFTFGRDRQGDVRLLRELGGALGFEVHCVEPVEVTLTDHSIVTASSSLARWLMHHGRVRDLRSVLGRPHRISGVVARGHRRGRTLGVPTANLQTPVMLPADGVYAGIGYVPDGRCYPAAVNVGQNPTFDELRRHAEVHLIGYDHVGDEYGWELHVEFHDFLRDQIRFASARELTEQMKRDIDRADRLIGRRCAEPAPR